jgi:hypothetical protein
MNKPPKIIDELAVTWDDLVERYGKEYMDYLLAYHYDRLHEALRKRRLILIEGGKK